MTTESNREGQREQEQACAQTFLHWLGLQRNTVYKLQRAEAHSQLNGRWDFIAWVSGCSQWLAIEVKGLVIPQPRRQFSSWSKFSNSVTKELQRDRTIQGSFVIITSVPWNFNQKQSKKLIKAFLNALTEIYHNLNIGECIDVAPAIASGFGDWPTKPPTIDYKLFHEQHAYKIRHPPEELYITKLDDTGCSIEIAPVSQAFKVDQALSQAVEGIFDPKGGKGAKPNEQLCEARQKGASETILLLDSHILCKPNMITQILNNIAQALMSSIDSVYLVSQSNNRIKKVWPFKKLQ